MKFRFIGQYTNGHTTINVGGEHGATFEGNEPAEIEDVELIRRLTNNPEFESVGDDDADDMEELRAAYTEQMGKKPYHGWDADTLREKMNG